MHGHAEGELRLHQVVAGEENEHERDGEESWKRRETDVAGEWRAPSLGLQLYAPLVWVGIQVPPATK